MLRLVMPKALTVAVDIVAWACFHLVTGYVAHRLDDRRLHDDGWLLRARRFETGGRWYRRRLRIDRWKDRLPELGAMFANGVSKRHLPSLDTEGLQRFARETRRAELAHWWNLCCGLLFVVWNPPVAVVVLVGYGVVANLPFIAIQRYNRFRIQALLERRS